ncbi:MAG: Smr/MutS family protein [Gemmatirosa sp.]
MSRRRRSGPPDTPGGLPQAFDAIAFGPDRTLNLRAHLPTRSEALARAEAWLREKQVAGADEVLVITGRGAGSVDGVSIVREAVLQLLSSLRRRNVLAGFREHTAGSFVVELAPLHALFEAPRRRREPAPPPPPDPRTLAGLDAETRSLLRTLATIRLQHLGVHSPTKALVEDEMLAQYGALARSIPEGPEREARLQQAVIVALEELDG